MLATVWILVAVLALANYLYWRFPPRQRWVNDLVLGGAIAALLLVLGWLAITLATVPMARDGMVIALLVALGIGGVMHLVAIGWRPKMPRLSVPFQAAWPRTRYTRRYASDMSKWIVEEVDD